MKLPKILSHLSLPIIAAPMFTVSYPELVVAQCQAGIVGSMPALNARPPELLDEWLTFIQESNQQYQAAHPQAVVGPLAINQIIHPSNKRLEHDLRICFQHRIPIFITSLSAPPKEMIDEVHRYGGLVFHDVINVKHAKKAQQAGVDGLILVAAGAGGHAGTLSPFALVSEIKSFFKGIIILSGAISNGASILAAQAIGADFAYLGTRFIATQEAHASEVYKQSLIDAQAADIVYSNYFTGVHGNYIRQSIVQSGLDPDNLPIAGKQKMDFEQLKVKAWKDIWGAGQGVGSIHNTPNVADLIKQLKEEYILAKKQLLEKTAF